VEALISSATTPVAASSISPRFRALQHRNFQLFFGGQLVSLIGTWMQSTAQLWLVYKLTGSAALLGVFGFANQIPILALASVGGYLGDRYDRHRGVIWTQTASMALAFLLAGLTLGGLIQGLRGAWIVIVVAFLVGMVNAFDVPIRQAFLVQMVGREDLPNAIALNSSIFNGARVFGPAIAGTFIAWLEAHHVKSSEGWCFLMNGISFVAVIAALLAMRLDKTEPKPSDGSALQKLLEGFRFAMNDYAIRSALLLLSVLSLFGLQYSVFLPVFAKDILHSGARGFGLLLSAAGIGAVMGALQFAARTSYKGLARWIAMTATVCAVGLIVFSQSHLFWLSAVVLFCVGFAATSQMAATNTTIQNRVPDELRGRVMAVYATMFMGIQPVGSLIAGGVAKRIGAPATLAIFGAIVLVASLIFAYLAVAKLKAPDGTAVQPV
jgi:MFS family permease